MKYRPQRGSLEASMAECVELDPSVDALAAHLGVKPAQVTVKPYAGADDRIGWTATNLVLVDGVAQGFTTGSEWTLA